MKFSFLFVSNRAIGIHEVFFSFFFSIFFGHLLILTAINKFNKDANLHLFNQLFKATMRTGNEQDPHELWLNIMH